MLQDADIRSVTLVSGPVDEAGNMSQTSCNTTKSDMNENSVPLKLSFGHSSSHDIEQPLQSRDPMNSMEKGGLGGVDSSFLEPQDNVKKSADTLEMEETITINDLSFQLMEVQLMCELISSSFDNSEGVFRVKGRSIDWDAVATALNSTTEKKKSGNEYHRIWKYVAYGEYYEKDTTNYPDSDEENYFMQPFSAVKRYNSECYQRVISNETSSDDKVPSESPAIETKNRVRHVLNRPEHVKHPSKKVKLIVSNMHMENVKPPLYLSFSNEKNLLFKSDRNIYSTNDSVVQSVRALPSVITQTSHKSSQVSKSSSYQLKVAEKRDNGKSDLNAILSTASSKPFSDQSAQAAASNHSMKSKNPLNNQIFVPLYPNQSQPPAKSVQSLLMQSQKPIPVSVTPYWNPSQLSQYRVVPNPLSQQSFVSNSNAAIPSHIQAPYQTKQPLIPRDHISEQRQILLRQQQHIQEQRQLQALQLGYNHPRGHQPINPNIPRTPSQPFSQPVPNPLKSLQNLSSSGPPPADPKGSK